MANDNEIQVMLTAQMGELQAGMEAGAASVRDATAQMQATIAEEAAAFNAAVQAKIDAIARLNAAFAEGIGSTAGIAAAEMALDQAMAAGALTASEYAGYVGTLDAAEAALMTSATAATVAVETNTEAMVINGGVAREVGVMVGELARGNYTRLEGSTFTLANRTGVLATALQSVMSPIGLATIGVAALGYEVFEAGADFRAMEGAVIATGQAAGYTAGQLDVMATRVGKTTGDAGAADEAFQKLAASGKFAGDDLRLVGTAAAEMAAMTGQSVGSIIAQIEKLQEDPLKAVARLNDQFHFLTVAEYEQMQQLVAAGDTASAASIAYAAMADNMGVKTEQVHEHVNVLIKAWRTLRNTWNEQKESANVALGGGDTAEQLAEQQRILKSMQEQNDALLQIHSHSAGLTAEMKLQTERVIELTAKLHEESAAAGKVGDEAQKSAAQIDAMAKAHKGKGDHDKTQADRDAFNEQRLQHNMSLAEEKDYWLQKKEAATAGTQEYRQAVQQLLEIKNKEATGGRESARREAEDARRSADVRMSTEREVQAELQAEAKKQQQLSLERLAASHDEAAGEIANKRQQYQNEYTEGKISAQQLLQLEQALVAQKLALDTKYLENKKKLDAGDVLAAAKDGAAIMAAKQSAQSQMLTAEKQYLKNSQKEWQNHAKKIEGAMQSAVTGMLFQHQTLRQGVANIALVIGKDFIQQAIMKPLDRWMEGEAQKIAASFSTQTTMQTQRAADSAAEAARGAASVVRAAGVAGAMGTASFAGAPWPVDMGAPAFGAGMAAAAASYAPMASAAGGWDRVPFDGAVTELHRDEMVLPKHIADPVRQMAMSGGSANGNGGGGNSYHFHSFDSNGIYDHARRRPAEFAKAMKHVARRGYLGR